MTKLIKLILTLVITSLLTLPLYAKGKCGTEHNLTPEAYKQKLIDYNTLKENYTPSSRNEYQFVPVQVWIVRTDNGTNGVSPSQIQPVLDELNEDYEPSNLYFYQNNEKWLL